MQGPFPSATILETGVKITTDTYNWHKNQYWKPISAFQKISRFQPTQGFHDQPVVWETCGVSIRPTNLDHLDNLK